jgi:predicted AAA+ superfamily ATPase
MIRREASRLISTMAESHQVLIIAGPRHAGKSVLARRLLPDYTYIDLDSPTNMGFARRYPVEFFRRCRGDIIIDEFHRAPELFKYIKDAAAGRRIVLITSRKPSLRTPHGVPPPVSRDAAAEAAANADVGLVTLLPPSIKELNAGKISLERDEYIHRGFLPDAYKKKSNPRETQLRYLTALLQLDIAPLIRVESREAFKRFFRLLAERVGLALNLYTFANTVGVSSYVIRRWIQVLEAHFVIFKVPVCPSRFHIHAGAIAIRAPKYYFTDVGLAAYLLKIQTPEQVHRHPAVGNLFENLVVAEALKATCNQEQKANMFYYRNRNGFEVDLILSKGCSMVPIEIKSSPKFNASFANNIRRFHSFAENIADGYVVYSGAGSDRVKDTKYVNFRKVGEIVSG